MEEASGCGKRGKKLCEQVYECGGPEVRNGVGNVGRIIEGCEGIKNLSFHADKYNRVYVL